MVVVAQLDSMGMDTNVMMLMNARTEALVSVMAAPARIHGVAMIANAKEMFFT